jgi:glycosyltransferase involved in cell wall biosynthesis
MTRFSVVIPLYNKESFIINTLNSVIDQTFSDFEILLINDSSTDNSLKVAQEVKDPRIKHIQHSSNKGLSASRNTGIKNAQSNYIAFLDADDLWKPKFLEKIDFLITNFSDANLFATKYEVLLKENKIITHDFQLKSFKDSGIIPNFFESNLNQSIYYPSCLCVRKDVFDDVGYYNEAVSYSEDIDFNIRAHAAHKMAYCNEALVTYLAVSENQITQNGLVGKTIPDYDFYEKQFNGRKDIKKYLDFQRYIKAKLFLLSDDKVMYSKLVNNIDFSNLNTTQKILVKSPKLVLQTIAFGKIILRTLGIEVSSYSN